MIHHAVVTTPSGITFKQFLRAGKAHFIRAMKIYQQERYHIRIVRTTDVS